MCSTYDESLKRTLKEFIRHSNTTWMIDRRNRALDHELDVEVCPDLVQDGAHAANTGIGEHDELEVRRRFKVMEFVFPGAVGEEAGGLSVAPSAVSEHSCGQPVIFASQLANHAAQGEDGTKDEFCIILRGQGFAVDTGKIGPVAHCTGT